LGEKKSELVDTLSQLRVDQETYDHMLKSATEGALPDRTVREALRRLETDRIARDRVVRTLESWRVSKEEIDALFREAERIGKTGARPDAATVHEWAKLEVRSPLTGVLLERNVAKGDLIDTTLAMFQIADLSRLRVVAYAYEEDLPALDALPLHQRRWKVRLGNEEGEILSGQFDRIGRIIDPNQHTALVMGWVDNTGGRYRVGQFVTAMVELLPAKDEVAIPAMAMVDEGSRQVVFVQPDAEQPQYFERNIAVSRRTPSTIFVRNRLTQSELQNGFQPLPIGTRVVSSGAVQLLDTLKKLQASIAAR
jgi:cobalt-zinc-cadmium efflux system membrane fusion protein